MRALILESGGTRSALAGARALGAAGWTVGVGTPTGGGIAGSSNAVAHRHRVPGPKVDQDAFIQGVVEAIRENAYEVVFGAGDAEVLALSARRDELEAAVPYADHATVVRAHDKLELDRAARAAGLGSPASAEASVAELERWHAPFLVKASLHAPDTSDGPARLDATLTNDRAEARRRAQQIRAAGSVPFLQEIIEGDLLACALVTDRAATVVAGTAQLAEATWPPVVGVSARARAVELDPALAAGVERLLGELGWFGLAHLQFLLPPDGEPRLIDLNGRFYGSLALAVAAGPNLPAIWACLATGRNPPRTERSRSGLRFQWLEGDLRRAASERRGGLARDLLGCLAYSRGAVHSVWSARDPRPSLHGLRVLPRRVLKRSGRPPG